jgi:hypothetical protein
MSTDNPEMVALLAKLQASYEAECKRGAHGRAHDAPTDVIVAPTSGDRPAPKAKRAGALKGTSKAAIAREIMAQHKDAGTPYEIVIQLIMDATGHDKALAKHTYKANAARVGITLK